MSLEVLAYREVALTGCAFYSRQVVKAEEALLASVDVARRAGCSWSDIGEMIGTSHQAAIKRFSARVTKVDQRRIDSPRRAVVRAVNGWKDPEEVGAT